LEAVSDVSELEKYCKEAIAENPKAVEDYKRGNDKALNFVVGAVMKKTKGKASPKEVNEIIKKLIK
jgi:aspartyl-tRNA(Asn)/glutamyl-tRNA(Gln) amidotransferase subunit B